MTRMIKRMAEKKAEKVMKQMGLEGLGKDDALGAAMGGVFLLVGWMMCWVVC